MYQPFHGYHFAKICIVFHGSPPAIDRLSSGLFQEVIITNTLPVAEKNYFPQLTVLSVANLLGETIWRVHDDCSVSSIFQWNQIGKELQKVFSPSKFCMCNLTMPWLPPLARLDMDGIGIGFRFKSGFSPNGMENQRNGSQVLFLLSLCIYCIGYLSLFLASLFTFCRVSSFLFFIKSTT